jgi:hypothetical protein
MEAILQLQFSEGIRKVRSEASEVREMVKEM